jgi:pyrimidine-specific ribonucleoside hydrolase
VTDPRAGEDGDGPRPVVLDVDTGVDDACALLLAARHPAVDLRAVTCVAGNTALDQVVRNTLIVLAAAGAHDVPVAVGADRPLLETTRDAHHFHGNDGMGDLGWPLPPRLAPTAQPAVELLGDLLTEAAGRGRPVTLVTLAPLTNIALLLRTHPGAAAGIERLVFMGGSAGLGNVTAAAEFNVWHDPEAAAIVVAACAELGIATTMYGLDVFYEPRIAAEEAAQLARAPAGSATRLAGELIAFRARRVGADRATIGDAGAVCAVIDPEGLTTRSMRVHVELAGTWTRGRTVVDARARRVDLDHDPHPAAAPGGAAVDVAVAVDAERYRRLWLDTVAGPDVIPIVADRPRSG